MARGRGNRVITGGGKPRKVKDWYGEDQDGVVAAAGVALGWLVLPTIIHEMTDPTEMAIEMHWAAASTANIVAGAVVAIGVYRYPYVTADGVALNTLPAVAAVQSPATDQDTDWVWRDVAPLVPTVVATSALINNGASRDLQISKAMRRLGNNESLLVVVAAVNNGFNYHWHGRALLGE